MGTVFLADPVPAAHPHTLLRTTVSCRQLTWFSALRTEQGSLLMPTWSQGAALQALSIWPCPRVPEDLCVLLVLNTQVRPIGEPLLHARNDWVLPPPGNTRPHCWRCCRRQRTLC